MSNFRTFNKHKDNKLRFSIIQKSRWQAHDTMDADRFWWLRGKPMDSITYGHALRKR